MLGQGAIQGLLGEDGRVWANQPEAKAVGAGQPKHPYFTMPKPVAGHDREPASDALSPAGTNCTTSRREYIISGRDRSAKFHGIIPGSELHFASYPQQQLSYHDSLGT